LGVQLVHFTMQQAFLTSVPSIYHPHDLQHIHLPEFFSPAQREAREATYRTYCQQASMVAVSSSWSREDVASHFGLADGKVRVVPLAPATEIYAIPVETDLAEVRRRLRLPDAFAFYPAQTWPHKNHIGLVKALAEVRQRYGVNIHLVCSGTLTPFLPKIEQCIEALGVRDLVHFVGHVSALDLQCLYRLSRCVVIPTRFESASFPLWEAFTARKPAACSDVTSLPAQAGEAALIFDPTDTHAMACAVYRLWTDEPLRSRLIERGVARVAQFSWERTARTFRAHYRRILGTQLSQEDVELIASPPLL
jgi:glycosyltransferase involved in cell wall biosynthesis